MFKDTVHLLIRDQILFLAQSGRVPIWDSYVDDALWLYKQRYSFTKATRKELWTYGGFRDGIDTFRDYFGLQSFTYREIDKFLWSVGYTLRDKSQKPAVAPPVDAQ